MSREPTRRDRVGKRDLSSIIKGLSVVMRGARCRVDDVDSFATVGSFRPTLSQRYVWPTVP